MLRGPSAAGELPAARAARGVGDAEADSVLQARSAGIFARAGLGASQPARWRSGQGELPVYLCVIPPDISNDLRKRGDDRRAQQPDLLAQTIGHTLAGRAH